VSIYRLASVCLASYLLGSVSWAYLAGHRWGEDLRRRGTGNLGARNVYRSLGWGWAILVGLGDVAKGAAGVWLALHVSSEPSLAWIALACCVAGHNYSLFLGFRGGKGLAAAAGGAALLAPVALGWTAGLAGLILAIARRPYFTAISITIVFPMAATFTGEAVWYRVLPVCLVIFSRHIQHLRPHPAG